MRTIAVVILVALTACSQSTMRPLMIPSTEYAQSGVTPEMIREFVYSPFSLNRRVTRMDTPVAFIRLSPELSADADVVRAVSTATQYMSSATQYRTIFYLSEGDIPAGSVFIDVRIDASWFSVYNKRGAVGIVSEKKFRGYEIRGATVLFLSIEHARNPLIVLHELCHAYGGGHTGLSGVGIMSQPSQTDLVDFTPAEKRLIRFLRDRPLGDKFSDDDIASFRVY